MKPGTAALLGAALVLALSAHHPQAAQQGGPARPTRPITNANDRPWPDAEGMANRKKRADERRLFRDTDPLTLVLTADFRAVGRDRDPNSERTYPASVAFTDESGTARTLSLQIRTRGHARRNLAVCAFAPLRLEFDRDAARDTVFDGHGVLKLGTHCRPGSEEVVLREHAIYRMFNLLTPASFRSRLARVTYKEATSGETFAEQYGLLIEDDDDVARRLEGRVTTMENVIFTRVDRDTLDLMVLFEYLIGNTDFSLYVQHNVRLVQTALGRRFPVPYDFDYAGLVNARYARPGPGIPIGSVKERLYRGPCRTVAEWQPVLDKLKEKKAELLAVYDSVPGLSAGYRREAAAYIEEFYSAMERPANVKRALIDPCVALGM